jgi:hypothetical protein
MPNPPTLDRNLIEASPLPQNLKEILIMREVEGKTNSEVSKTLEKDPSTTSGQYSEAKKKIEAWLQEQGPEAEMKREAGREQAEVFKLLQKNLPLTEIAIQTELAADRVSELADEYLKLTSKQADFDRLLGKNRTGQIKAIERLSQTAERSVILPDKQRKPTTYCSKCGDDRVIANPSLASSRKGKMVVRGVCPECGSDLESSDGSDVALLQEGKG